VGSILRARRVFKVIFVGDPSVGKTSMVAKHISSAFRENYVPTLGTNISSKDYNYGGHSVTLMIWDIAGQEMFKAVREKYYSGANAAFIVYDVTRPETFVNVLAWAKDIKSFLPEAIPSIIVGNKTDMEREVDKKDAETVAKHLGAEFLETSAKTGANIDEAFDRIIRKLLSGVLSAPQKKK
jgi:small GTP-binding protein